LVLLLAGLLAWLLHLAGLGLAGLLAWLGLAGLLSVAGHSVA